MITTLLIDFFWHLNVSDTTKYLILTGFCVSVLLLCLYTGKKKKAKKNKKTSCQKKYANCINNNMINGTNNFCYPCLNNGQAPDFFYNPQMDQWVTQNTT
jgi:hypothetical protein